MQSVQRENEKKLSVTEARQNFSDLVNQVQFREDTYVLSRNGKPAAAVVLMQVMKAVKKHQQALQAEVNALRKKSSTLGDEEAMEMAREAQEAVRSGNSRGE